MVWKEQGKRGIHSGRTVRRNVLHQLQEGLLVKYKENTAVPYSDIKSLLEDRYGITDGLEMGYIPNRQNTNGLELSSELEFSLGKRKRWLLPDLVKERLEEGDECESEEEFEESEDLHICFHERHIFDFVSINRGDCVSVYSDKDGQLHSKHKYSYFSDLRHKGIDTKPPEVIYEMCNPPLLTSWPNFREEQVPISSKDGVDRKKSKWKCKGRKNKGNRFGLSKDDCELMFPTKRMHSNPHDCKVKVITKDDFESTTKNMNTSSKHGKLFNLEDFTNTAVKVNNENTSCFSSTFQKYGKGCAIFVESDPMKEELPNITKEVQQKSFIGAQHKVNIKMDTQDIEPARLSREWSDNYKEGKTSPRKFAINITPLLPNSKVKANSISNVVFELKSDASKDIVLSEVSLVYASFGGDSELAIAAKDFVTYMQRIKDPSETVQVKEVVQAALQCIKVLKDLPECMIDDQDVTQKSRVKSVLNLDLLNSAYCWESEVFTLDEAQQEIKEKFENEAKSPEIAEDLAVVAFECGICYESCEDIPLTTMGKCGHSFCNECWAGYLETQVSQSIVKCPGYDCDCEVDSVTMMCLNPMKYERHLNIRVSKYLEISPDWQWCPGKHCKRLVKATGSTASMSVVCACATVWCFQCKKMNHWPATCAEAKKFEDESGELDRAIPLESQERISSVMVKNCPQCNYPIEKFQGCPFMHCVLCSVNFCWNCLAVASHQHSCDKKPDDDLNEVFLYFKNKRYQLQKFVQIVLHNIKARNLSLLFAKKRKVGRLEKAISNYAVMSSMLVPPTNHSRISRFMESVVDSNAVKAIGDAIDFEFQARVVVEGLAKKAAISKAQVGNTAFRKMRQLSFVTERIDCILQEPGLVGKDERIACLTRLVEMGTECILSLKDL